MKPSIGEFWEIIIPRLDENPIIEITEISDGKITGRSQSKRNMWRIGEPELEVVLTCGFDQLVEQIKIDL